MTDRPEKRAGELMRAGESLVDPELAAQLRAFMTDAGPAYHTPQPEWRPPPGWEVPEESAEQILRRQQALAAVKPRFLRRLEAVADRVRSPEPPAPVADPSLLRFDMASWRLQFAGDPRELQVNEEVQGRLRECAPQAVLRDLHRPVMRFQIALEPLVAEEEGQADAREEVRRAMATDHRIRWTDLPRAAEILAEYRAERRHWSRELDWAQCRPAEPSRPPSMFRDANDLKWFGP